MQVKEVIVGLVLCLSTANCSYVVNGKYHIVNLRDTLGISSSVEIISRNGSVRYHGHAPTQTLLKKHAGFMRREMYQVRFCSTDDRIVAVDTIAFRRSKSYWANLWFLNLPGFLIVDPWTGGMWISSDTLGEP